MSELLANRPCTIEAIFSDPLAGETATLVLPGSTLLEATEEEILTMDTIGEAGFELAAIRYGLGAPDYAFGPNRLPEKHHPDNQKKLWHNHAQHNEDVGQDSFRLGQRLELGSLACSALMAAGKWHDTVQTAVIANPNAREGYDELRSAQEYLEQMRRNDLRAEAAYLGAYMIMGTQVVMKDGKIVGQFGNEITRDELPSDEALLACQIGSSADLGRVFDNFHTTIGLFPQRLGLEYPQKPDLTDEGVRKEFHNFLVGQVAFQSGVTFALPEAEELFGKNRRAVVAHSESLVHASEAGDLPTDWDEFVRQQYKARAAIVG